MRLPRPVPVSANATRQAASETPEKCTTIARGSICPKRCSPSIEIDVLIELSSAAMAAQFVLLVVQVRLLHQHHHPRTRPQAIAIQVYFPGISPTTGQLNKATQIGNTFVSVSTSPTGSRVIA